MNMGTVYQEIFAVKIFLWLSHNFSTTNEQQEQNYGILKA